MFYVRTKTTTLVIKTGIILAVIAGGIVSRRNWIQESEREQKMN